MDTGVHTDFGYDWLFDGLGRFAREFPFLRIWRIGCTVLGRDIPVIRIGIGSNEVFYSAAMHANEWITAPVLMRFVENYARAYADGREIFGVDARWLFNHASIYVAPMVNPDGVELVLGGERVGAAAYARARAIAAQFPGIPFPDGWKANIDGIDLNQQFPAEWERAREIKEALGYDRPAPRDYTGVAPLVAPEAAAVYDFMRRHKFSLILAYHSQGRVIFWRFMDYMPPRAREIGMKLAEISGYDLADTPDYPSYAGLKDWFIQDFNLPGFTVEVGIGENPLPIEQLDGIYRENEGVLVMAAVL